MDDLAAVLESNWVAAGGYTRPTADGLYPHQWNWDSAFAALGWGVVDPPRGYAELHRLTQAQGRDGMVPHIAFSPAPEHYFPNARWWPIQRSADGRRISAISQPPVAATCLRLLFERRPDPDAARPLLDPLLRSHAWWLTERDPAGTGEPVVIHPWESGRDNAPDWDPALEHVPGIDVEAERDDTRWVGLDQRPAHEEYARYAWLVRAIGHGHATQRTLARESRFRVLDPGVGCTLAAACADLAWLGDALDRPDVAETARRHADRVERALTRRGGREDDGIARAHDVTTGATVRPIGVGAALNVLRADLPRHALNALERATVEDQHALATPHGGVRSWPRRDPGFAGRVYWRGPVWASTTFLVALGFERHGRAAAAATLRRRMVEAIAATGAREYVDGDTGEGLGARSFAWTAALALWTQEDAGPGR